MRVLAIITTRWKSTRFPGKALADLCGKPITQHIVDRLRQVKSIDEVVVIPSVDSQPIVDYCKEHSIDCLEHHKDHDYLGQIMLGALVYQPEYIVRVWGDCPVIDPVLVEETLQVCIKHNTYSYCDHPRYAGFCVSAFPVSVLRKLLAGMTSVSKYEFNEINEHTQFLKITRINLSVDTPEDLERVKQYLCQKLEKLHK